MKKGIVSLLFFSVLTGCATSTIITKVRSDPPGAKVSIGDSVIGTTPLTYDFSKKTGQGGLMASHDVVLKFQLNGYGDETKVVRKVKGDFGFANKWPREINVSLEKK